jgi:superfamily II DNA/RNA helicase
MASRKAQGKKKGVTITLGQLHNMNSTPVAEESWEDKEFDNIKPLNTGIEQHQQQQQQQQKQYNHHTNRHHQKQHDVNVESVKLPDGLTWEERQEALMAIDEEEAKKSPFYCNNFDEMGLSDIILRGIYSYGFEIPSRVQSRAIKAIITKKDCIVQAQSGTGKTGTFVIGTLNNIDFSIEHVQAIVLAPTRELADQIYKVFTNISQYCNIRVSLCVGQMRVDETINTSQIVVGTTGRVLDSIERKVIDVSRLSMLVMDEADEMLSPGFKEQVVEIYKRLPTEGLQVCLFSATLSPEVMTTSEEITKDPLNVLIRQEFVTL